MPIGNGSLRRIIICMAVMFAACGGTPQQREAKFLKRGAALLQKKDYSRAILEFQNAANVTPKHAEPYYQLGMAYLGSNNFQAAAAAFFKAATLDPKHTEAQLQLSRLLVTSNDKSILEDAEKRVRGILTSLPDNSAAIETLALAQFKLGQPDEAVGLIEKELAKAPADIRAAQMLAQIKIAQKDLPGAEEALKKSAASAPNSAPAALALGQFYRATGKTAEAEVEVRRALQLDPKFSAALFTLALIQSRAKRMDEAEQSYRQLASLPDAAYQPLYGRFLFTEGKRDAALAEFKRLYAQNPSERSIRSLLVSAHVEMNQVPEAQKVLAEALKKNAKDVDALLQDSQLRARSGDLAGAEKELRETLKYQPNSGAAHFSLALVQGAQGFPKSKRQELNEALRLQPAHLPARLTLVEDYRRSGEMKTALDILDQTPPPQKNDIRVLTQRNWVLLEMGNTAEARNIIAAALNVAKTPELVLQQGIAKFLDRDYAGARTDAEEVLKTVPDNVRAVRLLVDSYANQKQLPKAVEETRAIAARNPQSVDLQVYFAQLLMTTGDAAGARKVLDTAASLAPKSPAVRITIARLNVSEKRNDEARQQLHAALTQDSRNLTAMALLADLEQRSGNVSAATAHYRDMLRVDSSNAIAMNNLAFLIAGENPDEALKLAQQALELAPDAPAIQDTVGWVLYRKGIYSTALEHLKRAVEKDPTPQRQFHLAVCYLKSGDKVLGKQILDAALKQDPNLPKTEQGW